MFPNTKIYYPDEIQEKIPDFPEIKVIKTPGHTYNSICFLYEGVLFSGDTIFHDDGIGRTDLVDSVPEKMQESLDLLTTIPYKILCPGHI